MAKKGIKSAFLVLLLSLTIPMAGRVSYFTKYAEQDSDNLQVKAAQPDTYGPTQKAADGVSEEKGVRAESTEKLVSGPVDTVPWEQDEDFLKAMSENDTPILMGAYRTVLIDPLPGEEYNVHLATRYLAGMVVNPGEIFSQNRQIGPYTESRGFREGPTYIGAKLTTTIGGGVCKISSTLYNVAILSNLGIIERYNHSMPVPYVPYGQDATVSYGARDFKFKNNKSYPILIWAQGIDNILYIAFYGKESSPTIEWYHEVTNVVKAPTIYRKNPELPAGQERMILEGMDGATVRSWITIEHPDGTITEKELGTSYYRPMPNLVEKSN